MEYVRGSDSSNMFAHESASIGWSWRLFVFAIIVFSSVAFLALGMIYGYEPSLESQIKNIDENTEKLDKLISKEEQDSIFKFYSQIYHLENILRDHIYASRILDIIEFITHDQVYLSSITFDAPTGLLKADAFGRNEVALVSQLEILRLQPEINNLIFNGVNFDEKSDPNAYFGMAKFNLQFNINRELLRGAENKAPQIRSN